MSTQDMGDIVHLSVCGGKVKARLLLFFLLFSSLAEVIGLN